MTCLAKKLIKNDYILMKSQLEDAKTVSFDQSHAEDWFFEKL